MSDSLVYNIPIGMIDAYRGRNLVVRGSDPSAMVRILAAQDPERIAYLQVLGAGGDLDDLLRWDLPVPVDLVVRNPEADLPLLYRYTTLSADRPVRVTVPIAPGFGRVVKLALSLDFAVKLEPCPQGPASTAELLRVVDLYLHQSTVSRPVEYIHSIFLAFYHGDPVTLWNVQEEDPSRMRYVTEGGKVTISGRFAAMGLNEDLSSFVERFAEGLLQEGGECSDCRFFACCVGYFKWPWREYRCDGVKAVFQKLDDAAEELKADFASFPSPGGEDRA